MKNHTQVSFAFGRDIHVINRGSSQRFDKHSNGVANFRPSAQAQFGILKQETGGPRRTPSIRCTSIGQPRKAPLLAVSEITPLHVEFPWCLGLKAAKQTVSKSGRSDGRFAAFFAHCVAIASNIPTKRTKKGQNQMYRRRLATELSRKQKQTRSKRDRLPALKQQVEIDLECRLHATELPDEDSFLAFRENVDPGPFERLAVKIAGSSVKAR